MTLCIIDAPAYGTSKKCTYEKGSQGVLRIPNVVDGYIDTSDLKYADFDGDEISALKLQDGDFLMVRSNGSLSIVGTGAMVQKAHENFLYAGYLIRVRPNTNVLQPSYLRLLLSSKPVREQIERKAKSTSGVNNINSGEIASLCVPVCGINEQAMVASLLEAGISRIENMAQTITTTLQQAETLRQSILKRAFEGKLVPQDPDDEAAAELLARIRAEEENRKSERTRKKRRQKA